MTYTKNAPNTKPSQLEGEIRRIRDFPQRGLSVYRITDTPDSFIYFDGDLSQALQDAIDVVISKHVPNYTTENEQVEFSGIAAQLQGAYTTWDTMTTAQKDVVLKKLIRLLALYVKRL